jgi:hypothetical protein
LEYKYTLKNLRTFYEMYDKRSKKYKEENSFFDFLGLLEEGLSKFSFEQEMGAKNLNNAEMTAFIRNIVRDELATILERIANKG